MDPIIVNGCIQGKLKNWQTKRCHQRKEGRAEYISFKAEFGDDDNQWIDERVVREFNKLKKTKKFKFFKDLPLNTVDDIRDAMNLYEKEVVLKTEGGFDNPNVKFIDLEEEFARIVNKIVESDPNIKVGDIVHTGNEWGLDRPIYSMALVGRNAKTNKNKLVYPPQKDRGLFGLKVPKNIYDEIKYFDYSKINPIVVKIHDEEGVDAPKNIKKLLDWGLGNYTKTGSDGYHDQDVYKIPRRSSSSTKKKKKN